MGCARHKTTSNWMAHFIRIASLIRFRRCRIRMRCRSLRFNHQNYGAEFGGAGALVELSTRSGSNEIHGTAFEFLRNTDLAARNFFDIGRPPFKLTNLKRPAGGPIKKDKTFFFFAAQDTQRRSAPSHVSITTPTTLERSGNFSAIPGTIINPTNGQPFPGKIIPVSMFNPISVAVANDLIPVPNSGTQYISAANQNLDDTQYLTKIDHMFSEKDWLSVRYFYDEENFQRSSRRGPRKLLSLSPPISSPPISASRNGQRSFIRATCAKALFDLDYAGHVGSRDERRRRQSIELV